MKNGKVLFLKSALFVLFVPVVVFYIAMTPVVIRNLTEGMNGYDWTMFGIVTTLYLSSVVYAYVLIQGFRLLIQVEKKEVFTKPTLRYLVRVRVASIVVSGMYLVSLPWYFLWAQADDVPGVGLMALILLFAPLVFSVLVRVLEEQVEEAMHTVTTKKD